MTQFSFTIPGPPAIKKNSGRIITRQKNGVALARPRLLPSEGYEQWFKRTIWEAPRIKNAMRSSGIEPPIKTAVQVTAQFFRTKRIGDLLSYEEALADWLQAPRIAKTGARKGRQIRNGADIIDDDVLIESWDGSRRMLDAKRPRIEVTITILQR